MTVANAPVEVLTRLALPLAWRSDAQIATRLDGFASTEAGSALDMLKAAELERDPRMRRLFFRHALDEARHARMFRSAAEALRGRRALPTREYALIRATRQNLYTELGLVRFLAFVHVSERKAARQFVVLRAHFERVGRQDLAALLENVLRDEKFHVAYSGQLLRRLRADGHAWQVRLALARVRLTGAWQAWRRAGRIGGDLAIRALLLALYVLVVPLFALVERRFAPVRRGMQPVVAPEPTRASAARQS